MFWIKLSIFIFISMKTLFICDYVEGVCTETEIFGRLGRKCFFLYQHDGKIYSSCTQDINNQNCGLADSVDQDQWRQWGTCNSFNYNSTQTTCDKVCRKGLCDSDCATSKPQLCYEQDECVMSCYGMKKGYYPSCKSCDMYVYCEGNQFNESRCTDGDPCQWDVETCTKPVAQTEVKTNALNMRILCNQYLSDQRPLCRNSQDIARQSVLEIIPKEELNYIYHCVPSLDRYIHILDPSNILAIRQRSDLVFGNFRFNFREVYFAKTDILWEMENYVLTSDEQIQPRLLYLTYSCVSKYELKVVSMQSDVGQHQQKRTTENMMFIESKTGIVDKWRGLNVTQENYQILSWKSVCIITFSANGKFYIGGPGTMFYPNDEHLSFVLTISSGRNTHTMEPGIFNNLVRKNITTGDTTELYSLQYMTQNEHDLVDFILPIGVHEGSLGKVTVECGQQKITPSVSPKTTTTTMQTTTTPMNTASYQTSEASNPQRPDKLTTISTHTSPKSDYETTVDISKTNPVTPEVTTTDAIDKTAENQVGAQDAKQSGENGTAIAAGIGSVVIVLCIVIIAVVVWWIHRKRVTDDKIEKDPTSHANPVYNCDEPIQSNNHSTADVAVAEYSQPNKAGIYKVPNSIATTSNGSIGPDGPTIFVDNDVYNDDNVESPEMIDGMVENDVYNDDIVESPEVVDGMVENDVYNDSSIVIPDDMPENVTNNTEEHDGRVSPNKEERNSPDSEVQMEASSERSKYVNVHITSAKDMPQLEENDLYERSSLASEESIPMKHDSRDSYVEMVDNDLYS